ncbi:hypothetical protein N0V82_003678 [Gnomoniopsis sp. IMI 355080]|nr:hypothetical protein N0V82_003678 [Gnomoniopsis sp. IMI 355080]
MALSQEEVGQSPTLDPEIELSRGLSRLGYAPTSDTITFTRKALHLDASDRSRRFNSEHVKKALGSILPKTYTDILVKNFLEVSNYQYYTCFPAQLTAQCTEWWDDRAAERQLSPELTCLLLQVCASSTQFLEDDLRNKLEFELGEKAQTLTERFHTAAVELSASIPPGEFEDAIVMVQQLFLAAVWFKYEAKMIEAWHALGSAIRAAQESGMHKDSESDTLSEFDREMRRRLWCIIWNADWQMSGVLSRPVHTDQKNMRLGLPSRLEGNADPEVPTPIASVAYQAQIGVIISPLFRELGHNNSVALTLRIEKEVERWMDTFPAVLRDYRPNKDWDEKYPYVPFMRCQLNVVAHSFLLGPLKAYLIGASDPEIKGTRQESDLRAKGVDACLDLLDAAERFYKLIYPACVKYFFILFFIFDGATVLCSALAHDLDRTLPKRDRVVLALRNSMDLLEGVSHLSQTAVISAAVLKKLIVGLPLTAHERMILGWEDRSKRIKTGSNSSSDSNTLYATTSSPARTGSGSKVTSLPECDQSAPTQSVDNDSSLDFNPARMPIMGPDSMRYSVPPGDTAPGTTAASEPLGEQAQMQQQSLGVDVPAAESYLSTDIPLEHLENLWDWGYLNMDLP